MGVKLSPNAITSQVYLLKLQVVYTTTLCKFSKVSILGVESLFQVCQKQGDYNHQLLQAFSDFQTFQHPCF